MFRINVFKFGNVVCYVVNVVYMIGRFIYVLWFVIVFFLIGSISDNGDIVLFSKLLSIKICNLFFDVVIGVCNNNGWIVFWGIVFGWCINVSGNVDLV